MAVGSDTINWQDGPGPETIKWKDGPPPKKEKTWLDKAQDWGSSALEYGKGAVKGVASTLTHLGEIGFDPELDPTTPEARAYNQLRQQRKELTESVRTPTNKAQQAGFTTEQIAEYFIPGVDEFLPEAKAGAGLLRRVGTTALKDATRAGTVGTAQTGSLKEGAKQAAFAGVVGPAASETMRAVSPIMKKSAQHFYERFITPGGGSKFNKQIARESAEQMIKEGHLEWTKGTFTRHVDEQLQKANKEIEAIEDDLLNRLGYAPTGRYNVSATAHPYTTTGPVINVQPITPPGTAVVKATKEVGMPERGLAPHIPDETYTTSGTRYKVSIDQEMRAGMIYARPVIAQLAADAKRNVVSGKVVKGYEPVNRAIRALMLDIRRNMTPSGYIDAEKAIKFRRLWDQLVNWERPEGARVHPGITNAYRNAANALRHEIGEQIPGMADANAKYHFYANLNKVIKDAADRRVGHSALGLIGAVVGTGMLGHGVKHDSPWEEVAALGLLGFAVKHAAGSGASLTGSSVGLDRAAKLIGNRQFAAAVNTLAGPVASRSVRSDKKPGDKQSDKQESQ